MEIRVTKDFFTSLSLLSKSEQKHTKETIFQITNGETNAGLRYHKIDHPSKSIVSYSVNRDLRLISHESGKYSTLLYIDHHDQSYSWINKRKFINTQDKAIKIIVTKEEYEEESNPLVNNLHQFYSTDESLISALKEISDDDLAIEFISKQPVEIQDSLLEHISERNSSSHHVIPDFNIQVINDDRELQQALKFPLELWRIFLHPMQQSIVSKKMAESSFITGGPGTGKTVCLIHKIKRLESQLKENECLILTTFKPGLMEYLSNMLSLMQCDSSNIFIDDVSQIKLHEGHIKSAARISGLFQIENNACFYYNGSQKYLVKHVFFDEYQDFRRGQVNTIKKVIQYVPFTLAFDYSQAIYRNVKNTIEELSKNRSIELLQLEHSYRINSNILDKLKKLVRIIRVLSSEQRLGAHGLSAFDEELIENTTASITGLPIAIKSYSDEKDLYKKLGEEYSVLKGPFDTSEIVITAFFDDLYRTLSMPESHHIKSLPKSLRESYKFIPTLKGKEFKAGLVILDETICQLLNMNVSVLRGKVDTDFLGGGGNYRLHLNLLFVALSRFRDYLVVFYPAKYEIIIQPLLN
jgi:hypothetical protein